MKDPLPARAFSMTSESVEKVHFAVCSSLPWKRESNFFSESGCPSEFALVKTGAGMTDFY